MKLHVKKEFKEIIPPLSDAEFEQLELNCLQDGILDSIKQWNGYVIDGHNRFEIANKHNLLYDIYDFHFNNESEAEQWIVNNQLGRRNLTEEQREYLIGKRYKIDKKAHGGNVFVEKGRSAPIAQNAPTVSTAEKIGKEFNINQATVKRAEKYTEFISRLWLNAYRR